MLVHLTHSFLLLGCLAAATIAASEPLPFEDVLNGNKNLTRFAKLLQDYPDVAGALSWSQDYTLLAPSDDAIERIPYTTLGPVFENHDTDAILALLQYHVLSGRHRAEELNEAFQFYPTWLNNASYANVTGGQVVGMVEQAGDVLIVTSGMGSRSTITTRNVEASNCVIHIIDNLLVPPTSFRYTAPYFNLTGADGLFAQADVVDYVETTSDVTIFVPNNDALQEIGSGLKSLSTSALADLASYHIVHGNIAYSSGWTNGSTLYSRQGAELRLWFGANKWYVDSAQIIQQDLLIGNGVIHVIDNVLNPSAASVLPNPSLATQLPILTGTAVPNVPFSQLALPTSMVSSSSAPPDGDGSTKTTGSSQATKTASGGGGSAITSDGAGAVLPHPRPGLVGALMFAGVGLMV